MKGQVIRRDNWKVPVIYHSMHYHEMAQITGEPKTAILKDMRKHGDLTTQMATPVMSLLMGR